MKGLSTMLFFVLASHLISTTAHAASEDKAAQSGFLPAGYNLVMVPIQSLYATVEGGVGFTKREAIDPSVAYISNGVVWVADGTVASSKAIFGHVTDTISFAGNALLEIPTYPLKLMKKFVASIHNGEAHEFLDLVEMTGFVLTDIEVGLELFPHISFDFEHTHRLTDAERDEAIFEIEEHVKGESVRLMFVERFLLKGLLKAGEISDEIDVKAVKIGILPIPGATLVFDPVRHALKKTARLEAAAEDAREARLKEIELMERLEKLEELELTKLVELEALIEKMFEERLPAAATE